MTGVTVREIVYFCTTSALLRVPGIIFHLSTVTVAGYSISLSQRNRCLPIRDYSLWSWNRMCIISGKREVCVCVCVCVCDWGTFYKAMSTPGSY